MNRKNYPIRGLEISFSDLRFYVHALEHQGFFKGEIREDIYKNPLTKADIESLLENPSEYYNPHYPVMDIKLIPFKDPKTWLKSE